MKAIQCTMCKQCIFKHTQKRYIKITVLYEKIYPLECHKNISFLFFRFFPDRSKTWCKNEGKCKRAWTLSGTLLRMLCMWWLLLCERICLYLMHVLCVNYQVTFSFDWSSSACVCGTNGKKRAQMLTVTDEKRGDKRTGRSRKRGGGGATF